MAGAAETHVELPTTTAAREHARAQGSRVIQAMPTVPARRAESPVGVSQNDLTWAETIPGGGYAARRLARGTRLRLRDLKGDANVTVALFHADLPSERLCVPDTLKVLWNAYLGIDHLLLSDQGRVLASIVEDTSGRHDTLAGVSHRAGNEGRYGAGGAESASPAGRELLLLAGAKLGLSAVDLPLTISFFQGVRVAADGSILFLGGAGAGRYVDLLTELNLLVLVVNAAHPLDPRPGYVCTPLEVRAWRSEPTAPPDPRWTRTPEGERAFLNNESFLAAGGVR